MRQKERFQGLLKKRHQLPIKLKMWLLSTKIYIDATNNS